MTQIILVARIQYAVDGQLRTIGVSDAPYFDAAGSLVGGVYWPVIDPDAEITWSESARHVFHDQPPPLELGEIVLVNTGRLFDDWLDYQVSGFRTELRRGPAHIPWDELELVFRARNTGRRFEGRERFVLSLGNILDPLGSAWNQTVFDESVANPRLANNTVPAVLGRAIQVRGLEVDPSQLRYVGASNMSFASRVAEGGNPTENFVRIDRGWQLTQNPTLVITADIAGPPVPQDEEIDLLDPIGQFDELTDLDDWLLSDSPPDASAALEAEGLRVTIDHTALDFEFNGTPGTAVQGGPNDTRFQVPNSQAFKTATANWTEDGTFIGRNPDPEVAGAVLSADDNSYMTIVHEEIGERWSRPYTLRGFDFPIDPGARIKSIRADFVAEKFEGSLAIYLERAVLIAPDGSTGTSPLPASGTLEPDGIAVNTKDTYQVGGDDTWGLNLTAADITHPDFGMRFWTRRQDVPGSSPVAGMLPTSMRIYQIVLHVELAESNDVITLHADLGLSAGTTYQIRIKHTETPGQVIARWAGVANPGDPVLGIGDVFSRFRARLEDAGETVREFMADGPTLALGFATPAGESADQLIESIQLVEAGRSRDRYRELVPYIVEQTGLDPEENVAQDEIDAHDEDTGSMPLGWLVTRSETGDDLLFLLAGSLGGAIYHGLDGRVHSFLITPPSEEEDNLPEVGPERIDIDSAEIWDDDAPQITDRIQAARNWHPIPDDRTADITSTWDEQDRADVIADWRITRKARFDDLEGFGGLTEPLTISTIDPTTGPLEGGTELTITGTGFAPGATVTIGGEPATSVIVVDSSTITCLTPASAVEGVVDVVVEVDDETATLFDAFEYSGAGAWTFAEIPTLLQWLDADDSLTIDGSGRVEQFSDKSGNDRHFANADASDRPSTGSLAGRTVVQFNGANEYLVSNEPFLYQSGTHTVIAVLRAPSSSGEYWLSEGSTSNSDPIYSPGRTGQWPFIRNDSNSILLLGNSDSYENNEWILWGYEDDETEFRKFLDAPLSPTNSEGYSRSGTLTPDRISLGALFRSSDELHTKIDIAEIGVFAGISEADRQKAEGYLAHKWGLEERLPVDHPYKSTPP